jgi:sirohydrochlorin cobaltochelatase
MIQTHAINDMASDEEDSWKTLFNAAGITATPWLSGLGRTVCRSCCFLHRVIQRLLQMGDEHRPHRRIFP